MATNFLQNALNKVFGALGKLHLVPTASAYGQALRKFEPALVQKLTTTAAKDFYRLAGQEGSVANWRAHRLDGADGSFLTLPDNGVCERPIPSSVSRTGIETVQYLSDVH